MFEKPETDLPEFLPEAIICRNATHADHVQRQISTQRNIHVISADGGAALLCSRTFAKVTVCEGVDLRRNVGGEGDLYSLLRSRQLTWGDRAVFIVL